MKRRHRYLLNLISFVFLLFALYLNFIKKDAADVSAQDYKEDKNSSSGSKEEGQPISLKTNTSTIVLK